MNGDEAEKVGKSTGSKPKIGKRTLIAAAVIAVAAIIILAWTLSPSYSPIAAVHDADGDGVPDKLDAFPNNPTETKDSDADGYGDSSDAFPNDADEWRDTDGDGYGDNGDAFPTDSSEWLDSDKDGVGNNLDAFPSDATQWADRDIDGYGDNPLGTNPDAFPDDASEWRDSDSDGIGDNADFYDSGNGKVKISIDKYQGDGTADFWTSGDPFFVIKVDPNCDWVYESTSTSEVFTDQELLTSPYFTVVDIPDDTAVFRFWITVFDSDLDGDYVIDYYPTDTGTSVVHAAYPPYSGEWAFNGSDDGLDETDCILEYSLSVTA